MKDPIVELSLIVLPSPAIQVEDQRSFSEKAFNKREEDEKFVLKEKSDFENASAVKAPKPAAAKGSRFSIRNHLRASCATK